MVSTEVPATLDPHLALSADFAEAVRRHVDGEATEDDMSMLRANEKLWVRALYRLLDDIAESIDDVRVVVRGHQRALVVGDMESDYRAVDAVLTDLVGPPQRVTEARHDRRASRTRRSDDKAAKRSGSIDAAQEARPVELQLSWMPGRIIAWMSGSAGTAADTRGATDGSDISERLSSVGASTVEWREYRQVQLRDGARAESVSAGLDSCLGWLVALSDAARSDGVGVSVSWLGLVAALAVRLTAQGRIVPQLKKLRRLPSTTVDSVDAAASNAHARQGRANAAASARGANGRPPKGNRGNTGGFTVRWTPVLVESDRLAALAESLPGAAAAFERQRDARAFTQAVLSDVVNVIVTQAAGRVDMAAPPPVCRTRADVAEAALSRLNGAPFEGPVRHSLELGRRLDRWHRHVRRSHDRPIIVSLSPPDETDSWQLSVLSESSEGKLQPVERAMLLASPERQQAVKNQLSRLERLCPDLMRLGGRRRGEVLLSSDEAWRLMTETGPMLAACGYELRVPDLSHRQPTPALRITSLDPPDPAAGADQLANVRWSVVMDDVELSVEDVRELAQQARPLVKSHGHWVEIDRADLNATVHALDELASDTRMTGVDMLRHALGLEESPLSGPTSIAGQGWAVDLIRSAKEIPEELPVRPDGFHGLLRYYQAEALVWLRFLEQAGLGGCLALDMGLGKTPIMLAHIQLTRSNGTSLVVAPPAVVGNWQSEARRFVPELKVVVHHGPNRCSAEEVPALVKEVDVVITTYGTALRDMDAFEKIEWSSVVADEAQAIKNHKSETARQLRRLSARNRITLTGTPIENGLGDLWSIVDFCNPGLLGTRSHFIGAMSTVALGDSRGPALGAVRSRVESDMRLDSESDSGGSALGAARLSSSTEAEGTSADALSAAAVGKSAAFAATDGSSASKADSAGTVNGSPSSSSAAHRAGSGTASDSSAASGFSIGHGDWLGRETVNHSTGNGASVGNSPSTGNGASVAAERSQRGVSGEGALAALNGLLVFRRTKSEPVIADELPDRIDEINHCTMTREQVGLYQAVLDQLAEDTAESENISRQKGTVLAAITALKQICNHPVNYRDDSRGIAGRSGKLARLEELLERVFTMKEKMLIFTHFASWGDKLAGYLSEWTGAPIECYHGGLARGARDRMVERFQEGRGAGALVLSLKAGGTGLNLTAANHVVLYDRWWNPAVEDQARDRAWRIGQRNKVVCHRLVCPGTVDERVETVVAGKRHIADIVLPRSSSIDDLNSDQIQAALGIDLEHVLMDDSDNGLSGGGSSGADISLAVARGSNLR